jgi:hypothetical protein
MCAGLDVDDVVGSWQGRNSLRCAGGPGCAFWTMAVLIGDKGLQGHRQVNRHVRVGVLRCGPRMASTGIFECCAMMMLVSCRSKTLSYVTSSISPWNPKPLHKFFPFPLYFFVFISMPLFLYLPPLSISLH